MKLLLKLLPLLFFISCNQHEHPEITKRIESLENAKKEIKTLKSKIKKQEKKFAALKLELLKASSKEEAISESNFTADGSHKNDPFLGPKDAEIVIMAFSDFQCRPCRQFFRIVFPKIKEEFIDTNKIKFIFRDFPLEMNTHAKEAAMLAHCAGEQGAYWEAHDMLFSEIEKIDFGEFDKIREKLDVDQEKLKRCVESGRYKKELEGDIAEGKNLGAKGAPGFFLGKTTNGEYYEGIFIRGAQPFAVLKNLIERIES